MKDPGGRGVDVAVLVATHGMAAGALVVGAAAGLSGWWLVAMAAVVVVMPLIVREG